MIAPPALMLLGLASMAADPTPPGELPRQVFAMPIEDESHDLLFLAEGRPLLVRLRVRVDGQGFRSRVFAAALKLHREGDANRDGTLDRQEATAAFEGFEKLLLPPGQPGRSVSVGAGYYPSSDVSVEQLENQLRRLVGDLTLQSQANPNPADDQGFAKLDLDRDNVLSREELAAACTSLAILDQDDDETITAEELAPYRNPFGNRVVIDNRRATTPIVQNPSVAYAQPPITARRVMDRYQASQKEDSIGPDRLRIGPEAFERMDLDRNGRVDISEMARAIGASFDLEVIVRLGRLEPGEAPIEVVPPAAAAPAPFGAVRPVARGPRALAVDLGGDSIEVDASEVPSASDPYGAFFRAQFQASDADGNKVLEKAEQQPNTFVVQIIPQADVDRDGRLTLAELDAYIERRARAASLRTSMNAIERGRSILDLLDQNRDRKIGLRELRDAPRRLAREDRDGDGRVAFVEVVRRHQWTIGPNPAGQGFGAFGGANVIASPMSNVLAPTSPPAISPPWFLKMDRNRDGDLSPREFLGPRSAFLALDADGDGLITPRESVKVP